MARRPKAVAADDRGPVDHLDAALALIARDGWRAFSLPALAKAQGVPLGEIYRVYACRTAVLDQLGRRFDRSMLDLAAVELDEMSVRERLFELVMRRLDAMKPYRDLLRVLRARRERDAALALAGLGNLTRSAARIVDAAGITGPKAALAVQAVAGILANVSQTWLDDEDPDQGATLSALDKRLDRLERAARVLQRFMPARPLRDAEAT